MFFTWLKLFLMSDFFKFCLIMCGVSCRIGLRCYLGESIGRGIPVDTRRANTQCASHWCEGHVGLIGLTCDAPVPPDGRDHREYRRIHRGDSPLFHCEELSATMCSLCLPPPDPLTLPTQLVILERACANTLHRSLDSTPMIHPRCRQITLDWI